MIIESFSSDETFDIGKMLGCEAKKGDVFCFSGDLSCGKTELTKGFAVGLNIEEEIVSPTFSIVNSYDSGRLKFNHFDVYRLENPNEIENIGYEDYFYGDAVCVVEWAEMIKDYIPEDAIWVSIEKKLEKGEDYRIVDIKVDIDEE